jgi:hypothetical protein
MNRWWNLALTGILAVGGLAAIVVSAQAQIGSYTPPITQRPPLSPYLNMNRPGTNPAINYFSLVQPQMQTQQQLQNLQYGQNLLNNGTLGPQVAPLNQPVPITTTGHPVYYFDYARYFPLSGLPSSIGGGGGIGGGGAGGAGTGAGRLGTARAPLMGGVR